MIFNFVVRRLHFLGRIPGAAHLFDAWLLLWTALRRPAVLEAMEKIQDEVSRIPGVTECRHAYGGVGFVWGGVEFGHMHGNGLVDVRLTREMADELVDAGLAKPHHVFGRSAWVSVWIRSEADTKNAMEAVRCAVGTDAAGCDLSSGLDAKDLNRR